MSPEWHRLRTWRSYENEQKLAWRVETTCEHEQKVLRRMTIQGGAFQYRFQCLDCGVADGKAVTKPNYPVADFDAEFAKLKFGERMGIFPDLDARLRDEWFELYSQYLRSPEWAVKRAAVMKRAGTKCEGCGISMATQVHHLCYEHVTRELLFELVAICDECHENVHQE